MDIDDGPLIALANRSGGDIRKLLRTFFSFLHRRTDFYLVPHQDDIENNTTTTTTMGFREGDAEKMLLAAYRQFPLRRIPPQKTIREMKDKAISNNKKDITEDNSVSSSSSNNNNNNNNTTTTEAMKAAANNEKKTMPQWQQTTTTMTTSPSVSETTPSTKGTASDEGVRINTEEDTSEPPPLDDDDDGDDVRRTEDGLQIPVGNGGWTLRYRWTQTIDEASVMIAIPTNLRAKDLSVDMKSTTISVRSKRPLVIDGTTIKKEQGEQGGGSIHIFLEGTLTEKIIPDESTWSMEGGVMVLVLYKRIKTYWETIIIGDDKIDTSLVDSKRHISEYDESTQMQIRKIIHDQSRARKGLPPDGGGRGDCPGNVVVPPLPPGVEYIDQSVLDGNSTAKKQNSPP